ncbi:MAG TPA: type VI secretion system baseplate subunit TssF, partial [Opitutaceae bacterium]|nr:type VI secretion system baseplate subunit TssF [Opitutaceae bacterium]
MRGRLVMSASRPNPRSDPILDRYVEELGLLEDEMAGFAQAHPEVAGHLGISAHGTSDPHVRMLFES